MNGYPSMLRRKYKVVTTMNKKYYKKAGKQMIESFLVNWPKEIDLVVYYEDKNNFIETPSRRVIPIQLFEVQPGCKEFIKRHKKRPDQQNDQELHFGAVRFCYKVYSIVHAAKTTNSDYLIWLDADTYTFEKIPMEFLDSLVDPNKYITYLGRSDNYSECGFVIYNCNYFQHTQFMNSFQGIYDSDQIFELPQWHDSFVFDIIRHFYEARGMVNINLTPEGSGYQHVFIDSPLGKYIDHKKGKSRKDRGRSSVQDFTKNPHNHEYWNQEIA